MTPSVSLVLVHCTNVITHDAQCLLGLSALY